MSMDAALVLEGISKEFTSEQGSVKAIRDISCTIGKREIVCLMGPSGCGKSTVLRILAGLESADCGIVSGGGTRSLPISTAMVFQEHGLFPWLTVAENIAYGLNMKIRRKPVDRTAEKITGLLSLVHMEEFAHAYPHQLSGGMKQRVAVARALAIEPDVLLMDEPFSALDPVARRELQDEVLRIRDHLDTTFLVVTHNPEEAVYLADRILILSPRPAIIRAEIQVKESHPRHLAGEACSNRISEISDLLRTDIGERAGEQDIPGGEYPD